MGQIADLRKLQVVYVCNFVSTGKFVMQFGASFLWQANCCSVYMGTRLGTGWIGS